MDSSLTGLTHSSSNSPGCKWLHCVKNVCRYSWHLSECTANHSALVCSGPRRYSGQHLSDTGHSTQQEQHTEHSTQHLTQHTAGTAHTAQTHKQCAHIQYTHNTDTQTAHTGGSPLSPLTLFFEIGFLHRNSSSPSLNTEVTSMHCHAWLFLRGSETQVLMFTPN